MYSIFRQVSGDIWENSVVALCIKIAKFVAEFGKPLVKSFVKRTLIILSYSINRIFRISSSCCTKDLSVSIQ